MRDPRAASKLRSASRMKLDVLSVVLVLGACAAEPAGPELVEFDEDGKADGARATLPSCVAPGSLFATIFAAAQPVVDRGTVPARYFATQQNRAERDMLLRGP